MKRFISIILVLMFVVTVFAACETDSTEGVKKVSSTEQTQQDKDTEEKGVIAGVGETLDYNGLKLTLDSVEKYVDKSEYAFDKPTEEGNFFLKLNLTVTNDTKEDMHFNMFYEDSYCDGVAIEPTMTINAGDSVWGDVAQGKKRKGNIVFEVPESWNDLEFYYKADFFKNASKMKFKITTSDLK